MAAKMMLFFMGNFLIDLVCSLQIKAKRYFIGISMFRSD